MENYREGASIYYVRKIFLLWAPSPLLFAFHATYQYCRSQIWALFEPPLPPQCERNKWIAPKREPKIVEGNRVSKVVKRSINSFFLDLAFDAKFVLSED